MATILEAEARPDIRVEDVEYQRQGGQALLARLYRTAGNGPFPAVVQVHGGAWVNKDRSDNDFIAKALAESGILVASIDFRMPPEAPYPASLADINLATRWLKARARTYGSRPDWVGSIGTSSGGHQLLLSALKPSDPRYAALPLAEAPSEYARLPYLVLCWPISDPLARYRMVRDKGNGRLIEAHDAYWRSAAEMEEGNPQLILERGEGATPLPPAIVVQGTGDDNVTPDMADRFAAAYRARGGALDLHKYDGQPHTFIVRDPASDASRRATEVLRDFVLAEARSS